MDSNLKSLITYARTQGFTINVDNYEIEVYKPGATISAVFNRNDIAGQRHAGEYIREVFAEQAHNEQDAIKRLRAMM